MAGKGRAGVWGCMAFTAAVAALLLGYAPAAARGAAQGVAACGSVILPTIFPFLVLSGYLAASPTGAGAAAALGAVAGRCYRLPPAAAPALLLSWVGGYPAGARALAELRAQGLLSHRDAASGACVCIHSGPAFLVGAVGTRLFGSAWVGAFLFLCQLAAGLLMARLLCLLLHRPRIPQRGRVPTPAGEYRPFAGAVVHAVTAGAGATVNICAFVILLSAVGEALTACGVFPLLGRVLGWLTGDRVAGQTARCLLTGMLEICAGCAGAASLPPTGAARILPFLLSFGGCSVWCQVAACFGGEGLPWGQLLLSRLLHGALTALLAAPWLSACAVASAMGGRPVLAVGGGALLWGTVWMLLLCVMLFLRWEGDVAPIGAAGKNILKK